MQNIKMARDNIINTYFSIFNMYRHSLSPQEKKNYLKVFKNYLDETYSKNDKKIRYTHGKK